MVALSRNVSSKYAMEMLLTGDMTSVSRAAEIGLVNRIVAPEALREATMEMARKIASKSSMTLATGKRAFYAQREMPLSEAYDHASRVMVENMLARDAEEGIGAFIGKRTPVWLDS
jgi:enoyl-CoA hydratase/carnithine racemase